MANSKTGITYHEDMMKHRCLWDPNFPECPERFTEVLKRCNELGLVDRCKIIPPREATDEEIFVKHSPKMMDLLKQCENMNVEELEETSSHYDAIFICPETCKLAKLATGSVINLVKTICDGDVQNGMAIIRPPGHHAMESAFCGYCFFNNVALAADYVLKNYNLSRILIVDWDVHHGQATQQMFYDDNRVLYFSIHRYEYGTFWPNLRESDYDYIGEGAGKGYNFNVPLNKTGFGNAEYLAIFNELLLPVATEYDPELIIVSSGYDAAIGCYEGNMKVEPACYAHFINSLARLAGGKIMVVLEGGYFIKSLAEGAALTLRALLGDPCPNLEALRGPDQNIRETIRNVIYSHRELWNCFKIYDTFLPSQGLTSNCHNPVIKFEYDEEPLQVFPTRGAYPTQTEEMKFYFNEWLEDLKDGTILTRPKYKLLLFSDQADNEIIVDYVIRDLKFTHNEKSNADNFLLNVKTRNVEWQKAEDLQNDLPATAIEHTSAIIQSLIKAIHYLRRGLIGSAIITSDSHRKDFPFSDILSNYLMFYSLRKALIIDLFYGEENTFRAKDGILSFRISNEAQERETDLEKCININWNNNPVGNFEYVTLWLKTILPICYEYAPTIIFIFIDFETLRKNQITVDLLAHLIHWLNALARGKIVIVTDKIESEFAKLAFMFACRVLVGESIPNFKLNEFNNECVNVIKVLNSELETKWSCLNTFVKFPLL